MAEGLLKAKLPPELKEQVIVRSAGTLNLTGNRATPFAIAAANKFGANIANHRSQGLSKQLVYDSDIVLVMDQSHKEYLLQHFPDAKENIFLLKEFSLNHEQEPPHLNIIDPIGNSLQFYETICDEINNEIERIVPTLIPLIKNKMNLAEFHAE